MSTPTPRPVAPAETMRTAIVGLVVLVGLGVGSFLALYALTPVADRPELLDRLGTWVPALIVGVPALLAWLRGEQLARDAGHLRQDVQQVVEQTNGSLTARMQATADEQTAELEARIVAHLLPALAQLQDGPADDLAPTSARSAGLLARVIGR